MEVTLQQRTESEKVLLGGNISTSYHTQQTYLIPYDVLDARDMRGFAINYMTSRFMIATSEFKPATAESCFEILRTKMPNSNTVDICCKVLLLESITLGQFETLKQEFSSEFPQFYESSQTKYLLFHLLMDRIVRYTYTREDILYYGKSVFDRNLVHMFYWYDPRNNIANWGDVFGPIAVQKLSRGVKIERVRDFQKNFF